jgi:F-type H+-transporting ATPase subunit b
MDATFYALVGLLIFLGIMLYIKVPATIAKALDERGDRVRRELDEAKALREEAQKLLAEYQKKRKDAETEAEAIVTQAKRDADAIVVEARAKTEDYVKRRQALAEQKIGQAERDAIGEVKSKAVEIAIAASTQLLGKGIDSKAAGDLFKSSLAEIKSKLN